ncbi:MAG: hypothetical protein HZB65_04380, partial [Candidatus Aenigmarchaeota archaeon]|nr:hypothetical protein [Candidatus Aenigmarchaeota archaeon]
NQANSQANPTIKGRIHMDEKYIRVGNEHGLKGKTPAEAADIDLKLKSRKLLSLIRFAAKRDD